MDELTLKKAYELHDVITNDERYINLLKLEKEMEEDDEVCTLSYKKDLASDEYNEMLKLFKDDRDEVKRALKKLHEAKKELESHPKVVAYLKSYAEFRNILNEINEILFEGFTLNLCPKKEK